LPAAVMMASLISTGSFIEGVSVAERDGRVNVPPIQGCDWDCRSSLGVRTKAAEGCRTPRRFASNQPAHNSARFWSAQDSINQGAERAAKQLTSVAVPRTMSEWDLLTRGV
jgi:hypothetical protein